MSTKQLDDAIASYKKRKAAGKTKRKPREADIEAALRDRAKALGGIALKLTSPARRGAPDRLVLMPGGRMFFVELKAPGAKPTPNQLREHAMLRQLGFRVDVIDDLDAAKAWSPDDSLNLF